MQTPSFKVGECNWLLTPEQELELIAKGVSEVPVPAVFQDAAQLHNFASSVSTRPTTNNVVVHPPTTTVSSTVSAMIDVLRNSLHSAIVSYESILMLSCEALIYDPRFTSFIQFKSKMDITYADASLLILAAQNLYDHAITVATGGNQSLLFGTLNTVKQAAKNLQFVLPIPPVPVAPTPASSPMIEEPLSLGSLGSMMKLLEDLPSVVSTLV